MDESSSGFSLTIPQALVERRPLGSFVESRLILRSHQLILVASDLELTILYSLIQSIERRPAVSVQPRPGTFQPLVISMRQFQVVSILLPNSNDSSSKVYEILKRLICISSMERHCAFSFQPRIPYDFNGWSFYNSKDDFVRLGVGSSKVPWRFTEFNQDYSVSPTYPRMLTVPEKISDAVLFHAAKFRSRGRLPALTFVYRHNNASITRSSQPLIGLKAKRSIQDEKLLEAIFDSNLEIVPKLKKNVIIDARPLGNALANRAMGAGTESTENYKNCKRLFMGIDNIHVMRDSLNKLTDAVFASDPGLDKWHQALENSSWLKHIRTIMESTKLIVQTILDGGNVLIHCSDGWDRTAQLSSLASIVMDPHYRTLKGFQTLIEKEWLSFGHKFSDRCGHINSPPSTSSNSSSTSNLSSANSGKEEKETAPIFLQFLECTHLLMRQFPGEFEFNEHLLYALQTASHSCQFGTFMLNNERERMEADLAKRTHSFWSHVLQYHGRYLSPLYQTKGDAALVSDHVLDFSTAAKDVYFWSEFYSRYEEEKYGGSLVIDVPKERRISLNGNDALLKAEPNPFLNRPRSMDQILLAMKASLEKGEKSFPKNWKRSHACHACKTMFHQSDTQYPHNHQNYCLECINTA